MAFKDRRRVDPRDFIQGYTYWITSDEIDIADTGATGIVIHAFDKAGSTYIIDGCILEVLTDLNAGSVNVGHGTLPATDTAESGTLTTTTADSLWATATGDETSGTIMSWDDLGAAPVILDGAESTVPVVIATVATAATGKFRVHFRVSEIPTY